MLEARSGAGPIKAYPRPGAKLKNGSATGLKGSGLQNKTFHCQICDVHVNSEIQLKQVATQLESQAFLIHIQNVKFFVSHIILWVNRFCFCKTDRHAAKHFVRGN